MRRVVCGRAGVIAIGIALFWGTLRAEYSIYVTDSMRERENPIIRRARVFAIDPVSGDRQIASGAPMIHPQQSAVNPVTGITYTVDRGTDFNGVDGAEAVWKFDPARGVGIPLSGLGYGSGVTFVDPNAVALAPDGNLIVVDQSSRLIRVDRQTGERTLIEGSAASAVDIAISADGFIYLSDSVLNKVFRINPADGARTVASGGDVGTGPAFSHLQGVVIESSGSILAADDGLNAVIRINLADGARTIVSSNNPPLFSGPFFETPMDVAVGTDGGILVVDSGAGVVFRLDAAGNRTIVSRSETPGQVGGGPDFFDPEGLTVDAQGSILVTDRTAAVVIAVDGAGGGRRFLPGSFRGSGPEHPVLDGIASLSGNRLYVSGVFNVNSFGIFSEIFRIDLPSGNRTTVAGSFSGSGPQLEGVINGVAALAPNLLFVVDRGPEKIHIVRIDANTGERSIVGQSGDGLGSMLVGFEGLRTNGIDRLYCARPPILAVDLSSFERSQLPRWDEVLEIIDIAVPSPGKLAFTDGFVGKVWLAAVDGAGATLLSDATHGSGPALTKLWGIETTPDGALVVVDYALGAIFRIDPVSGDRLVLSGYDSGTGSQRGRGPLFADPRYLTVADPLPLPSAFDCADINHDDVVDVADLIESIYIGIPDGCEDANHDGSVNEADIAHRLLRLP